MPGRLPELDPKRKILRIKPSIINPRGKLTILFFGESPGEEEKVEGKAFVGAAGKLIRRIIQFNFPDCRCVLDNICPEYLGRRKPDGRYYEEYKDYRYKAVDRYKPRVLVLLGEHAMKAWAVKGGYSPTRRNADVSLVNGLPAVLSVHPAYVKRRPREMWMLERVARSIQSVLDDDRLEDTFFRLVTNPVELRKILGNGKAPAAFDIETSSVDPEDGEILCVSIHLPNNRSQKDLVIPLFHPESPVDRETADKLLKELLQWWPKGPRCVHNAMFELVWMSYLKQRDGEAPQPKHVHDTMVQSWMVDDTVPRRLKNLVSVELGGTPYWLRMPNPSKVPFSRVPFRDLSEYNAYDSHYTWKLKEKFDRANTPAQRRMLDEVWFPLSILLSRMQYRGLFCSVSKLLEVNRRASGKIRKLEEKVKSQFPLLTNPRATRDVADLCYRRLGLEATMFTKRGDPSVEADALKALAEVEPSLHDLAELRKLLSFRSRIVKPWKECVEATDGYLRPHYYLASTPTGRLTTRDPNLMNIDRTGPQREALISRFPGGKIVHADYSQHELRCYAAVAGDETFHRLFSRGIDPHTETAKEICKLGVPCTRQEAKNINFSITYDITPDGLEKRYGIPYQQATRLIGVWHEAHPWLEKFHEWCRKSLTDHHYVANVFDQRRYLADVRDPHVRRQAYNHPVQSVAVQICLMAMIAVEAEFRRRKMKSLVVFQLHDAIDVDSPPREARTAAKILKEKMLGVDYWRYAGKRLKYDIPLAVDVEIRDHF